MRKLLANHALMPALMLVGVLGLAACDDQGGNQQGQQQQGQQGQLQQGQQQQGGTYSQ